MKQITTSSLGYDVPVTEVPETIEEGVQVFGGEQQLLDAAITYIRLHRTNTEVRDELCDRIAQVTGVSRKTKQVKSPTKDEPDRMVEEYDESEADFAKRAHAEAGKTAAQLAPQVLNGGFNDSEGKPVEPLSVAFRAVGAARTGAGRKMAKVYTDAANQLIGLGTDQYNSSITQLEANNPGVKVERDDVGVPKAESLAAALKTNRERVIAEAEAGLGLPKAA